MKTLRLNRRAFFKSSTLAAAPFILPAPIWAAETPPNSRLNLGFVGMGKQNRGLLGSFIRRSEVQVVAICEVDTARREDAKRRVEEHYTKQNDSAYKGCAAYNDFRQLLERRDIDAVVIATPDHWHAIIAIAAANAGKDIYCEKPLTQSIHEARALVTAVRKNNRVFQTGSMQRSSKEFHKACELVRNGVVGKLEKIEVAVGGPPVSCDLPAEEKPEGLDWNLWLGPAPERPYNSVLSPRGVHDHFPNWRNYKEYGGGGVTDWGAHHFDIAQWALGMDASGPIEVIPPEDKSAKYGVKFIYPNGVPMFHTNGNGVTFFGEKGKLYVNRGKFETTPTELGETAIPETGVHLYKSTATTAIGSNASAPAKSRSAMSKSAPAPSRFVISPTSRISRTPILNGIRRASSLSMARANPNGLTSRIARRGWFNLRSATQSPRPETRSDYFDNTNLPVTSLLRT